MAMQPIRNFSGGVVRKVASSLMPTTAVYHALNFLFDRQIGEATLRSGSTLLGSQLVAENNVVRNLHNFRDPSGSAHALLAAVDAAGDATQNIYNVVSGAAVLSGDTAGLVPAFETFLGVCVRINGTDAVSGSTTPGTAGSWVTTGTNIDLGNMPNGIDVLNYKDRLHVLTAAGLLRRSSPPTSASSFTAISWTSGNDTIVVDPDQTAFAGTSIGLTKIGGKMLIFKQYAMYTFNGSATQADYLVDIGCSSRRSIAIGGGHCFFFNPKGIWITEGGYPTRISDPVQPYIEGMSTSNYASVAGRADQEHYLCSLGDTTVDGETYTNVVLRYSIQTKEWAVLSYATQPTCFSRYINGTAEEIVYGDSTARVLRLDVGSTDNGTAIPFVLETHDIELGSRSITKEIAKSLWMLSILPPAPFVQKSEDGKSWKTIGTMINQEQEVQLKESIRGRYFRFRIIGGSSVAGFRFLGIEPSPVTAKTDDAP